MKVKEEDTPPPPKGSPGKQEGLTPKPGGGEKNVINQISGKEQSL